MSSYFETNLTLNADIEWPMVNYLSMDVAEPGMPSMYGGHFLPYEVIAPICPVEGGHIFNHSDDLFLSDKAYCAEPSFVPQDFELFAHLDDLAATDAGSLHSAFSSGIETTASSATSASSLPPISISTEPTASEPRKSRFKAVFARLCDSYKKTGEFDVPFHTPTAEELALLDTPAALTEWYPVEVPSVEGYLPVEPVDLNIVSARLTAWLEETRLDEVVVVESGKRKRAVEDVGGEDRYARVCSVDEVEISHTQPARESLPQTQRTFALIPQGCAPSRPPRPHLRADAERPFELRARPYLALELDPRA
ncbi:hypothetical protein BOTBODRAFT_524268 [Botryobasidium botryosum FD-172 SS1]|uniref:Uncharacterized protein n=1 Tax=Botryobasidium botryosum (strain FD-172 SS1) TaxID=930990 RepID=A0A067M472_BOTB1|nr:hypothetical protein BOTBODRAFT_524268 [Botryobasidium botryosum FD-172 SS1]